MKRCVYCNEPIPRPEDAYQKVNGWERKRAQGGTNAIKLRQTEEVWACVPCVDIRASGRLGQESMFG